MFCISIKEDEKKIDIYLVMMYELTYLADIDRLPSSVGLHEERQGGWGVRRVCM